METIHLTQAYQVKGFKPANKGYRHPHLPNAVIIPMKRLQKKVFVLPVVKDIEGDTMTARLNSLEIYLAVK